MDTRSYWRVVLAICAPLPWLIVGVSNALTPYALGGTTAENVAGVSGAQDRVAFLAQLQPLFFLTFVPSVLAVVALLRSTRPRAAAILGTLGILGALAGTANPPTDAIVLSGLRADVAPHDLVAQVDELATAWPGWVLFATLLFITVGRLALGVVFWRADLGPRALAALFVLSPFVEFGLLAAGAGNLGPTLAWALSGYAMLYVTVGLLRMSSDEFDLAPRTAREAVGVANLPRQYS